MPKSLAMSSGGMDFDSFMKAIVRVKMDKPKSKKRTKKKQKSNK